MNLRTYTAMTSTLQMITDSSDCPLFLKPSQDKEVVQSVRNISNHK